MSTTSPSSSTRPRDHPRQGADVDQGVWNPEAERALVRARDLCCRIEDASVLFPVQAGLRTVALVRAELQTARALSEELLRIAHRQQDPVLFSKAYGESGQIFLFLGELRAARTHLEQGIACYNPQQHYDLDFHSIGASEGVCCWASLALTLWLLGYPEQALTSVHAARALAQQLSHPASLVSALDFAVGLYQLRREVQAVQEHAQELRVLASAQEFPFWVAWGTALQGWAVAVQTCNAMGIAQMWEGLAACRTTGIELNRPWLLALIAEVYGQTGQAKEGLAALAEALALVDKTRECWYEAELYWLKGELLLERAGIRRRVEEAAECFLQALNIARRQQAKSFELRAAMSLARLWQRQGKCDAARDLLAATYGWFTEGFDTVDLQEAQALLQALEG